MKMLRLTALATAIWLAGHMPLLAQGKPAKGDEKPKTIQIDPSKLPPDLAKALLEFTQKKKSGSGRTENKGAAEAISLVDAIGIAEKAGKGRAIRASRKDGLDYTHFTVSVSNMDGTRTTYTIGVTGKVLQQKNNKDRD